MPGGKFLNTVRLLAIIIAVFGLVFPASTSALTTSQLEQRLTELKRQEEANRVALEQKKREANTLEGAISGLDDDIAYTSSRIGNTEAQIDTTNQVIDALLASITASEQELGALNSKLNTAYVTLYELSQTSTMELILQSNSLDEVVSQAQYIQSIQTDLQSSIEKQNAIKVDLQSQKSTADQQKANLETLRQTLASSRTSLNNQRRNKDILLDKTQGQQSEYERIIAEIKAEATQVSAEIKRNRQNLGGYSNGGSGYTYAGSAPDIPDQWGFLTRECTSYAAWWHAGQWYRNPLPPGISNGHAKYWPAMARDRGIATGNNPVVGAYLVWGEPGKYLNTSYISSAYGHVAVVERVHSTNDVEISEYNWDEFAYTYRRINPNFFGDPTYIYL